MSACEWTIDYSRCGSDRDQKRREANPQLISSAEDMATELLDRWTGGVFGLCPFVVRPCRTAAPEHATARAMTGSLRDSSEADFARAVIGNRRAPFQPVMLGGKWFNLSCGRCGMECKCGSGTDSIALPHPLHEVTRVRIDGKEIPASSYRTVQNYLVRIDGGSWPTSQDLTRPATENGTFEIEFTWGRPVPIGGQIAAGALANEIFKALCDDEDCRLPERVQTVTRQGVTVGFADDFAGLEDGKTGIWLVDAWVSSVRTMRRPSRVYSPDLPHRQPTAVKGTYAQIRRGNQ